MLLLILLISGQSRLYSTSRETTAPLVIRQVRYTLHALFLAGLMEGFLNKKARGEKTIFARHEWSRRWFVLDGQILEYFESFDVSREKPINSKVSSTGSPLRSVMLQP